MRALIEGELSKKNIEKTLKKKKKMLRRKIKEVAGLRSYSDIFIIVIIK